MTTDTDLKELRFRKMVEEVEDYAILLLDPDGYVETWNKGAERIKGYKPADIIGKNFRAFYSEADRQAGLPDKLLAQATREGKAKHEGWRIKKNGEKFWGSVIITAIHDSDGDVIGFSKVTRDLTDKKQTQENLRRSEERFQKMIEEIQDYAILLLDQEGNVENWNMGAEKIKGYTASEIVGRNFRLFYIPEDNANGKPQSLLNKAARQGRAQDEGWRLRKDGTPFWANVTLTALHNSAGDVIGFSKVTRDMTEIKKAEDSLLLMQRLEARNDELEQLTYITSHDLQEPLRNISSFIDVFAEDYAESLDAEGREMLTFIQNSTSRMTQLIQALLTYGRLGRNSETSLLDTRQLTEEVCDDLQALILETGAKIEVGNLPKLCGYRTEFRLLLQNLIGNAIKFRRPGMPPHIRINAEHGSGKYLFCIQDNGIGIEPQHLDRIFLIFQRLHTAREFEGNGIGLAHCKRIVELHHGRIWVTSEPGKGSTFYFTIHANI